MSNFVIALIRTVVPVSVGALFTWLLTLGLDIDAETKAGLIAFLTTLLTSLYYVGVSWLASKVPAFGWLLGVARKPVYEAKHDA